jgi:hypothetical protein
MFLRVFKSQQPVLYFFVSLLALLLWIPAFLKESNISFSATSVPLFSLLYDTAMSLPHWLFVLITMCLVLVQAFYLNYLVNEYEILYKPSFVPATLYIIFMSIASSSMWLHPLVWVNLLMLAAFHKVFQLFKNSNPIRLLFDAGLLVGTAFLFYAPGILYLPLLMLIISMTRAFNLREWLITLTGFILPFYFVSVWFYWNDSLGVFLDKMLIDSLNVSLGHNINWTMALKTTFGFMVLLTILSMMKLRNHFYKNSIRTRINQRILIYTLFASVISLLLVPVIYWFDFSLAFLPLSVFIGYYLITFKNRPWIAELLFTVLLVLVVWNRLLS